MAIIKVLTIGDIVGEAGRNLLKKNLYSLRSRYDADVVIANGENSADGNGIDPKSAEEIFGAGVDVITGGNHIWRKNSIFNYIDDRPELIRPANFPDSCPGYGYVIKNISGYRVLVISLLGVTYMTPTLKNPFDTADSILSREKGNFDLSVLDFHAEATSEKICLANYLDGRVNIVVGTHTHVQTADIRVLPNGSGYITDLGMTGPSGGALGVNLQKAINRFRTGMPMRYELEGGDVCLSGAYFAFDTEKNRVVDCFSFTQ